ncbi:IS1182 family transposase [Kitasatospora cineracea]|uniref:IS1182 family transposase n=1 Tax=Kitasatospora cineracea TaxID=88074 RepID=UPI0036D8E44C
MSLRTRASQGVPEETARVARAAFPKGSMPIWIREALGPLFDDESFTGLFPRRGRPALSPAVLALACVFQFAAGLSDREAAQAVRARIDWKFGLGLELTDPGFDHSVLSEFRNRLIAGGAESQILDTVLEAAAKVGLLRARGRQRTDSTHILSAARDLNRLELAGETLRAALNALAAAAPDWLAQHADDQVFERYRRRIEDYWLPRTTKDRIALGHQMGQDGMRLLEAVLAADAEPWLRLLPAVEVLRRVWVQEFQVEEGEVRWRKPGNLPPGARRLATPYDVEARSASKRETEWQGWKVHLTETCDPDRPNLITHVLTTDATVPDVHATAKVHQDLAAKELLPGEHFVDSGYTGAQNLFAAKRDHEVDLVGPVQKTAAWQGKDGAGFAQEDFAIDWDNKQVTCPMGKSSRSWNESSPTPTGVPTVRVWFSITDCEPCPSRSQCTRGTGRIGRRMTFHHRGEFEALRKARADQQTDEWRRRYHARAGIEGTIAQAVHGRDMRRARYHGLAKTHLQHQLTAAAINLARVDAWLAEIPRAKTRASHLRRLELAA